MQFVGNLSKTSGNHTFKFGVDVRRAYNLRVPSDTHRSGELTFSSNRTRGPAGGGLGLATFLLGDVTSFGRYVSPNTDARERQWRHFYYGQDTWRATQKLTVNYGLRLDIINPQTINEPGNAGFLDLDTGEIKVVGVGDIGLNGDVENSLNWAPRLALAYQLYGEDGHQGGLRTQLRHRRVRVALRPLRDTEPAGAVGAAAQRAGELRSRLHARAGPPPPDSFPPSRRAAASRCRTGSSRGRCRRSNACRTSMPSTSPFQRRSTRIRCRSKPATSATTAATCLPATALAININQATLDGYPGVPRNNRRPYLQPVRLDAGHRLLLQLREQPYNSLQTKFTKRFSNGYSVQVNYTLQKAEQENGEYLPDAAAAGRGFIRHRAQRGSRRLGPHAQLRVLDRRRAADRTRQGVDDRRVSRDGSPRRRVAGQHQHLHLRAGCRSTSRIETPEPTAIPVANRADLVGDPDGAATRDQWFNATPIGDSGSAFRPPATGTFGDMARNYLRGPGYWRVDASLFKHFTDDRDTRTFESASRRSTSSTT